MIIFACVLQKKGSDSEESFDEDSFNDDSFTSPPKREGSGRRAATKVHFEPTVSFLFHIKPLYWFIHSILQKVNYAKLLDGSDEESNDKPFSSDDDDDLLDNTGIKEASIHQVNLDESDNLFDSLKEESPKPKPKPRKLGAKPEVVKDSSAKAAKRSKKNIGSDDDSPIKVNQNKILVDEVN